MDKREKGGFSPPALGGSSLLVIFAVLALTVFALLSLSTVRADVRLADASAKAVEDYYAADCKAQEILARLRSGEAVDGVVEISAVDAAEDGTWRHDEVYQYTVPISDTQELQVLIECGSYQVLRWQAVSVGEWAPDTGIDLWDGGELP